jgi:hypothetical protein
LFGACPRSKNEEADFEMPINQSQAPMDSDFLDGIDDQFQRLMKLYGNGKRGASNGKSAEDRLAFEILEQVQALSGNQREQVLAYIQMLKQKAG